MNKTHTIKVITFSLWNALANDRCSSFRFMLLLTLLLTIGIDVKWQWGNSVFSQAVINGKIPDFGGKLQSHNRPRQRQKISQLLYKIQPNHKDFSRLLFRLPHQSVKIIRRAIGDFSNLFLNNRNFSCVKAINHCFDTKPTFH